MYLLDLKPGGNSMLRNNNMSSTFRNSTFRKINYVDTWTFVIFKCILYCAAAWGVQGPKRANDIFTMTSPIANMWNFVQYFFLYVQILFWVQIEHCSFSCQTSRRFAQIGLLVARRQCKAKLAKLGNSPLTRKIQN